jgi:hypothetical protein
MVDPQEIVQSIQTQHIHVLIERAKDTSAVASMWILMTVARESSTLRHEMAQTPAIYTLLQCHFNNTLQTAEKALLAMTVGYHLAG